MLRRHLHILEIGCHMGLNPNELADASASINTIKEAVTFRVFDLKSESISFLRKPSVRAHRSRHLLDLFRGRRTYASTVL